MAVTQDQLDSFHRFATERLNGDGSQLTLSELLQLWLLENPTPQQRDDAHAAIRQGIEDINAGRGRPAEEVMEEMRSKYNLSAE